MPAAEYEAVVARAVTIAVATINGEKGVLQAARLRRHLERQTRADLFRDNRRFAGKIVLLDRIVWFERPGAAPSANHAWFVWEGYQRFPRILYAGKAA